jgi:hypothetical protein
MVFRMNMAPRWLPGWPEGSSSAGGGLGRWVVSGVLLAGVVAALLFFKPWVG